MAKKWHTILLVLFVYGVWDKSINVAVPLGIVMLVQSIREWKQQRGIAIFGLCAAFFILGLVYLKPSPN